MTRQTTTSTGTRHDLISHICQRISAGIVDLEPFPHLVIDEILPPSLFQHLITALPSPASLQNVNSMGWKSVSQYPNRGTALVTDLHDPDHLWHQLDEGLCDVAVEQALQTAFASTVAQARCELNLRRELRLDCATDGSGLQPHTDAPILFMKSLIYLSAASSHSSLDTVLYVPRDREARLESLGAEGDYTDDTYRHENRADHLEHSRVQFLPNRLLTFPRTRDTLHGLDEQDSLTGPRYLLSLHYKHSR